MDTSFMVWSSTSEFEVFSTVHSKHKNHAMCEYESDISIFELRQQQRKWILMEGYNLDHYKTGSL